MQFKQTDTPTQKFNPKVLVGRYFKARTGSVFTVISRGLNEFLPVCLTSSNVDASYGLISGNMQEFTEITLNEPIGFTVKR